MPRKDRSWMADSVWLGFALGVLLFVVAAAVFKSWGRDSAATLHKGRVTAACVGNQLKEIDQAHASFVISYDLQNRTGSEFRLTQGSAVILTRQKSDGTLSQDRALSLNYPVCIPPGQHAQLALQITQPFAWPAQEDPAYLDKLRGFVKGSLENVSEFVVFDQASQSQLELPNPWGGHRVSSAGF